jgi:Cellulase (glycosyl hydrolase family 5)
MKLTNGNSIKSKTVSYRKYLYRKLFSLFSAITIFAFIAVFGISLITGNTKQSGVGSSSASAQEPADINSDGRVDIFDLSTLLSNWNRTGANSSDINSDSTVNIFDLSMLLSKWGTVGGAVNQPGIYVSGNKLVNGAGEEVILHGVNKMGSEYACIDGWGFFDGPTDQASINVMKTWNINAVRITMNSVCWNNGPTNQFSSYNSAYAGANYKNAIKNYVNLLVQNDIHPILDLQWAGCGTGNCFANWIKIMPDRPGAVNFWSDVATTFKDNKAVLFDLYNEPQNPGWQCWRDGGCIAYQGDPSQYTMAGMQELVTAVRSAGATTQPIMLGGLNYSNEVTGWLQYLPNDPSNSLVNSPSQHRHGGTSNRMF